MKYFKSLLVLTLILVAGTSHAVLQPRIVAGNVMARGVAVERDENGEVISDPILVKFDDNGQEAGEVRPSNYAGDIASLTIISGSDLAQELATLDSLQNSDIYPGAELLSLRELESSGLQTITNDPIPLGGYVNESFASYVVKAKNQRFSTDVKDAIVHRFVLDMTRVDPALADYESLVVDIEGKIVAESQNYRIGYRAGFFGNPNEVQSYKSAPRYRFGDGTVYRPFTQHPVETTLPAPTKGATVTSGFGDGVPGRYAMTYLLWPCPDGMQLPNNVTVEVQYSYFNPASRPWLSYIIDKPFYEICTSFATNPANQVFIPPANVDVHIDVNALSGLVRMVDHTGQAIPVSLSEPTEYHYFDAPQKVSQHRYDFDGDGRFEQSVAGQFVEMTITNQNDEEETIEVFQPSPLESATHQGVYLSSQGSQGSRTPNPATGLPEPDLVRLIDQQKRLAPTGFVKQLGQNDARNTDIYFFRESDGSLITERIGLKEEEMTGRFESTQWNSEDADFYEGYGGEPRVDDQSLINRFSYQIFFRGNLDERGIGGGYRDYTDWAHSHNMLQETLQDREGDHIQPGEVIRIVAINRATGYVGSVRHTLGVLADGNINMEAISEEVEDIDMGPPNLKVWAERKTITQKGATQGEANHYLIGSEGAATTDDETIVIYTHWLDADGSPLPAALDETRGLQGRIAKITAPNTLGATGDMASFSIKPGLHAQHINLGSNLSQADHYYIHVIGQPKGIPCPNPSVSCADFESNLELPEDNPYKYRPKNFTPILTPVYNEQQSLNDLCLYQQIKRAADLSSTEASKAGQVCGQYALNELKSIDASSLETPAPAYEWHYRPEYQFSQFDLQINAINKLQTETPTGDTVSTNILEDSDPKIEDYSHLVEILYNMNSPAFDRLEPIDDPSVIQPPLSPHGGHQQLVFSVGGEEYEVGFNQAGQIQFDNIAHLSLLAPADYLTMSLYANNDPGNLLWQFAFDAVGTMFPDYNRDGKIEFHDDFSFVGKRTDLVSVSKPMVIWINDDDDNPESETETYSDASGHTRKYLGLISAAFDWENDIIDGSRDLIDFFPVALNLEAFFSGRPDYADFSYTLSHPNEAVNVVFTDMQRINTDKYLNELDIKQAVDVFGEPNVTLADVPVMTVSAEGIPVPLAFIEAIKQNPLKGVFLIEGRTKSTRPMEFKVSNNEGEILYKATLPLRVVNVDDMQIRLDLMSASLTEGIDVDTVELARQINTKKASLTLPDTYQLDENLVFVHGFSVNELGALAYHHELFKRFFHAGSNKVFTGVTWNAAEGTLDGKRNYWGNVHNAFNSARDFAAVLSQGFAGEHIDIVAHSLGNVLVGTAIQDDGLAPNRYAMVNAAVPIEAYDSRIDALSIQDMQHPDWAPFVFNDGNDETINYRLWSSHWYQHFTDTRNSLTWRGRFDAVVAQNMFSGGDEVLAEYTDGVPYIEPLGTDAKGTNSWVAQEKLKGAGTGATAFQGDAYGGWGFNCDWENNLFDLCLTYFLTDQAVDDASQIPIATLKTQPWFDPFPQAGLFSEDAAVADTAVADHRSELLARALPALSHATGSHSVNKAGMIDVDMNIQCKEQNKWPEERGPEVDQQVWRHSDFKDVSYLYVHKLFTHLVKGSGC